MSVGRVRDLDGQLFVLQPIYVEGPNGNGNVHIANIDTGFTGQLTLPAPLVEDLNLEFIERITVVLGNNETYRVYTYRANTFWDNQWQQITVLGTGDRPLIGMDLLRGNHVCFDAIELGEIGIEPLSTRSD